MEQQARQTQDGPVAGALVCLECQAESRSARGWRAYIDAEDCLLVYCPHCAAREFDS